MHKGSICLFPQLTSTGGPSSFQKKLTVCLEQENIDVHFDPQRSDVAAILVTGGSRHLSVLKQAKERGVRIIQRLDGMNWLHKRTNTGWKHYLRSEWNNHILSTIRSQYADGIVYQSEFTRNWWNQVYQPASVPDTVIHNGVDLDMFNPRGSESPPKDHIQIMVIETGMIGGHERDILNAIGFARALADLINREVELMIAGKTSSKMVSSLPSYPSLIINWLGIIPLENIPVLDRSSHLFFSAEINAACPNTVMEAMACGTPVLSFATGSLPELVQGDAGKIVEYGSNYWELEEPDFPAIAQAGLDILNHQARYRKGARKQAEDLFDMHDMAQKYLEVLLP